MDASAIILAAGLGSRMEDLTAHKPKACLDDGSGFSFLWHNLSFLAKLGIKDVYVNSHYLSEQIKEEVERFNRRNNFNAIVTFEEELLETIGTVVSLKDDLKSKYFFLISTESVFNFDLIIKSMQTMYDQLLGSKRQGILLLGNKENSFFNEVNGDFNITEAGDLTTIEEKSRRKFLYTGIGLFEREFFENFLPGKISFGQMLEKKCQNGVIKTLEMFEYPGNFANLGTKDRYKMWQECHK